MVSGILSVVIFVLMFGLIMSGKIERYYCSLGAAALVIVFVFLASMHSLEAVKESLNLQSIIKSGFWFAKEGEGGATAGINWSTIIFISGMMIMVEGLAASGFFRVICSVLAKAVHYKPSRLFFVFMILSAYLSMFIDSITVILFLAAITIELSRMLKFDPICLILPEIFCANLGGAATMSGDPPNIIIGTALGYSFFDFLLHTGPAALAALLISILYFYLAFRRKLREADAAERGVSESFITGEFKLKDFVLSSFIFTVVVVLLVTHSVTGLTVAAVGLIAALLTALIMHRHLLQIITGFDYKTILFFIGLFIAVSGLEQTGMLKLISQQISNISGGNAVLMIIIIIWASAFFSAVVDNIPFAATMVPVIQNLASVGSGVDLHVLAYSLALGTDIGGNATPVGASANVVGVSIAEESGHKIGWGTYLKYALPATLVSLTAATLLVFALLFRHTAA